MSLKSRLLFSFAIMIGLSVILGAMLILSVSIVRSRYHAYEQERKIYDILNLIEDKFEKQGRSLNEYLIGLDSEREQVHEFATEISRAMQDWQGMIHEPLETEEHDRVEVRINLFQSAIKRIEQFVETDRRKQAVDLMDQTILALMDQIRSDLDTLQKKKQERYEKLWKSAQSVAHRTIQYSVIILAGVILTGFAFSIVLYHAVSRPLVQLIDGAKKIGTGDWNIRLNVAGPTELQQLGHCFEDMAQSLKEFQMQVVQMSRMSAVGTLAGGVAHEINNPLSGVLGQAQILLEKMRTDDPNRPNVQKIERAALRCKEIVRGLLNFSRAQDYQFQPVEVNAIIESTLALCESQINATGIRVEWEKKPSLPKILGSEHHLQQVFLNIITNAIHAMPDGGELTIQTRVVDGDTVLAKNNSVTTSPKQVEIQFIDTGSGIEPKNLPHLFDPFFTTKEPGKGTGLGLSISYGIVQQHKGSITAQSPGPNQGAAFIIRIPVA